MEKDNYTLDREVIQKLQLIKKNKEEISRLKNLKDNIFSTLAEENTFGLDPQQIEFIIKKYKDRISEINQTIAPYTEGNSFLQEAIAEEIIDDYERKNVDSHLLIDVTKEYPGIASVKIHSTRTLEMNPRLKEKAIQELIDNNMLQYLDINMEEYLKYSKRLYAQGKKHATGIYELQPTHKVKISFKK